MAYRIVRMYQRDRPPRVLKSGLTLDQAQAHCSDPETSSSTATSPTARRRTARYGPWFDGYEGSENEPATPEGMRRVDRPNYRANYPQVWHDDWRNADRVLRYRGTCVSCGRRCYAFDDGENDPRGVLGDHAADVVEAAENGKTGPDVVACFMCMNDEPSYRAVMRVAEKRWS